MFDPGDRPLIASQSFSAVAANAGLMLQGESGQNSGSQGYEAQAVALQALAISYDAVSDSYTLTLPTTTRSLELDKPINPAPTVTTGLSLLQTPTSFVRVGQWLTSDRQSTRTGYEDRYFAFGMPTQNGALVRAGSAGYAVSAVGRIADLDNANLLSFGGQGAFFVDFGDGQFRARIPVHVTEDRPGTPGDDVPGLLIFAGSLAGSSPTFSGATGLQTSYGNYNSGQMQGQFFGPEGEELGGSFTLVDQDSSIGYGAFAGVKDASVRDPADTIPSLFEIGQINILPTLKLGTPGSVPIMDDDVYYWTTDRTVQVTFPYMNGSGSGFSVHFGADTQQSTTYTDFEHYMLDLGAPAGRLHAITLAPFGGAVQLSYLSLGEFIQERGTSPLDWNRTFAVYGMQVSLDRHVPKSGTASYDGMAYAHGRIVTTAGGGSTAAGLYWVEGRSSLSVDWGAQRFTATIDGLNGQRTHDAAGVPASGSHAFDPLSYSGALTNGTFADATSPDHHMNGAFYGTDSVEFGAVFFDRKGTAGVDPVAIELTGVAAGRRP